MTRLTRAALPAAVRVLILGLILGLTPLLAGCGGDDDGDPLADTAWSLERLADAPVPDGIMVTARFREGRVGGISGCNRYFASYEVTGDSLRIGPAGATKKMCAGPEMAIENRFLAALPEVAVFRVGEGRLVLLRRDGSALTFSQDPYAAPEEPR